LYVSVNGRIILCDCAQALASSGAVKRANAPLPTPGRRLFDA